MSAIQIYHQNPVTRWNPFSELEELDRLFSTDFFTTPDLAAFKTDLTDEGDHFLLKADLPGFAKEDIHLDLEGDTLTVRAERHSEHEQKENRGKYVRCERSYGSYSRSYDMTGIDVDKITASCENGVLSLTLPKKESEKSTGRQIAIN